MRKRSALVGLVVALAAVMVGASPAHADEILDAGEIESEDYPSASLIVTLPPNVEPEDLADDAFQVVENGDAVPVESTLLASEQLDVVLAIDTSGSMRGDALNGAKLAAFGFIASLPDSARVAVVGFGATPTVASELTDDRSAVAAAIDSLEAGGETALYDAVRQASEVIGAPGTGRRALVVLSDGGDTVSTTALADAKVEATAAFDVVHAIALASGEQDTAALALLVDGGGSVAPAVDSVALGEVYADVANQLVNQYRLEWTSTLDVTGVVEVSLTANSTLSRAVRVLEVPPTAVPPAPDPDTTDLTPSTTLVPPTPSVAADPPPERTLASPADTMSTIVLILGIVALALAFFVVGLLLFMPRERRRHLSREFLDRIPERQELSTVGRRFVLAVDRFLRRDPERRSALMRHLERAGIDMKPAEAAAVGIVSLTIAALAGFALAGVLGMIALAGVVALSGWAYIEFKAAKRRRLFTEQLDATLQLMAGSLRSGFGVQQAIGTVGEETEWPTNEEFQRVVAETRLGRDMVVSLHDSAARIDSEDYYWVVQAIEINRDVGGNLAEVLDNVSSTIRARNTLRRKVRALSAEGRMSAAILFALPLTIFTWMRFTNAEYVGLLFETSGGRVMVITGLGLMVAGGIWLRRIIEIRF